LIFSGITSAMLGNGIRHSPVIASPWIWGRSRSSQEGQPVGRATEQKGAWPGTGTAVTQLEAATMSLRQGLRPWGPMGRRSRGCWGGWAGPARSVGGTSYTYWACVLFCSETVCHTANTDKESPIKNFQSDCFHSIPKYLL